jgi:hypothetical protein
MTCTVSCAQWSVMRTQHDLLCETCLPPLNRTLHVLWCWCPQAALKQSFMPTAVRWLPHGLGYFLNLTFTTVRFHGLGFRKLQAGCQHTCFLEAHHAAQVAACVRRLDVHPLHAFHTHAVQNRRAPVIWRGLLSAP